MLHVAKLKIAYTYSYLKWTQWQLAKRRLDMAMVASSLGRVRHWL